MNGFYLAQQESSSTYRVMAFANAARAQAYIATHRLRNVRPASQAHGRKLGAVEDLRDYDPEMDELAKEAMTMTTTQRSTTVPHEVTAIMSGQPAPAAPRSAAHQEVAELREEVAYLRDLIMRYNTQTTATLAALVEGRGRDNIQRGELRSLVDHIVTLLEQSPATRQPAPLTGHVPAAQPDAENGERIETLDVIRVDHEFTKGRHYYKVVGGRYTKHGVPLYEEIAKALGYDVKKDPNAIPLGENDPATLPAFPPRVTVLLAPAPDKDGVIAIRPRRVTGAA